MLTPTKSEKFEILKQTVRYCRLCPRLAGKNKVLSEDNGTLETQVVFVAEAPGRLGAARTGIPLYGDQAGKNFQKLLDAVRWEREKVFITNAVLCNPTDTRGKNTHPAVGEITNCSVYLSAVLDIIHPAFVVTLGTTALRALSLIHPHSLRLKRDVRRFIKWDTRTLIPLYHPGPRVQAHRSFRNQLADFYALAERIDPLKGARQRRKPHLPQSPKKTGEFTPTPLQELVVALLRTTGALSKFKLVKLVYLVDYAAYQKDGTTVTRSFYLNQKEGPVQASLSGNLAAMEGHEIVTRFADYQPYVAIGSKPRFEPRLDPKTQGLLKRVLAKYSNHDEASIKRVVYLTDPMRRILREELKGRNMLNKPIFGAPHA